MRLALAGDTMLGRGVAERLASRGPGSLFAPEVAAAARAADLVVLNLECCLSERGAPWPDPDKPFFFRAPPAAVEALTLLGVDCVTLANNHALDYGEEALRDTFEHLAAAGIRWVGAGPDLERARAPIVLEADGFRLAVVGVTDHPAAYAAGADSPGVAYANLWNEDVPEWLLRGIGRARQEADAVLVMPHWGPNMRAEPAPHVRRAGAQLVEAGATLVAGHSAHAFQPVEGRVLYDLGDFVDDYAVYPAVRNDLGILWLVDLDESGPQNVEALPLKLDYCHTRVATGDDRDWIERRLSSVAPSASTFTISVGGGDSREPDPA
ncbi:MAG TPA: CapA family protein [Gaiellaceae bacterium]|nr:CapA family protein [Gaiellaceae bacterium]